MKRAALASGVVTRRGHTFAIPSVRTSWRKMQALRPHSLRHLASMTLVMLRDTALAKRKIVSRKLPVLAIVSALHGKSTTTGAAVHPYSAVLQGCSTFSCTNDHDNYSGTSCTDTRTTHPPSPMTGYNDFHTETVISHQGHEALSACTAACRSQSCSQKSRNYAP